MVAPKHQYDQVIYLLQGGGALGAYQVGVIQGLLEHELLPDWVIGTSIGGINGAIIAGNKPEDRLDKLKEFWDIVATPIPDPFVGFENEHVRKWQNFFSSELSVMNGVNGFFKLRNPPPIIGQQKPPEQLSYYDTRDLEITLGKLVDLDILNSRKTRLTLSAVCVEDGKLERFDNFKQELTIKHIMATGALPPGLPAVKIGDNHYWDGGLSSNTPLEVVVEENINSKLLCFSINLFSFVAEPPETMLDVLKRKKDLEFTSRYHMILHYFCELQRMQHHLQKIYNLLPESARTEQINKICNIKHPSALSLVRFHYQDQPYDLWTKDFEFSKKSLDERMQMGYKEVTQAFTDLFWLDAMPDGLQIYGF